MTVYRKINIHVGPTLCEAKLETRKVCTCGMLIVSPDVPLKKTYQVDLRSVRWVKFVCYGCGKKFVMRVVDVWDEMLVPQWFPLACLDLDAAIPYTPIPTEWQPVVNNLVAPAHGTKGRLQ